MKAKLLGLVAGVVLLGVSNAHATTYDYTGDPFTIFVGSVYTNADNVTGSVTLSAPLGDSLPLTQVIPQSFSFSDGVQTLDGTNTSNANVSIQFGTDSSGNIIAWAVEIESATGTSDIDTINTVGSVNDFGIKPVTVVFSAVGQVVDAPGTWTVTTTPLPAALPLFAGGLGLIGFVAGRRERKNASPLAAA